MPFSALSRNMRYRLLLSIALAAFGLAVFRAVHLHWHLVALALMNMLGWLLAAHFYRRAR